MSDQNDDKARTVGEMDAAELMQGIGNAVGEALSGAFDSLGAGKAGGKPAVGPDGARTDDEPTAEDRRRAVIDEGANMDYDPKTRAYAAALRVRPSWERQYDRLPERERAIGRCPEGDVHTWRFFRALLDKDLTTLRQLRDEDPRAKALREQYPDDEDIARQLSTGAASGEALVPVPLADQVIMKRDEIERIAPRARRVMSPNESLRLPRENNVVTGGGVAQNATIPTDTVDFDEIVLTKQPWKALAKSSRELLSWMSGAFSLSTILSDQAARKLAVYMDDQSAQTGNTPRTGQNHLLSLANATVTEPVAGGALTRDVFTGLYHGLASAWRVGAPLYWMMNAQVLEWTSNLEDSTGRPLYPSLLERSVQVTDQGPGLGLVEGIQVLQVPFTDNDIMLGMLDATFTVLMDDGLRIESTTEGAGAFENDQVAWKFVENRDSAVTQTDGLVRTSTVVTAPA